jgi:hypothetical protein
MKKKHVEKHVLCTHETNNYLAMKAAATTILAISKTQDKFPTFTSAILSSAS